MLRGMVFKMKSRTSFMLLLFIGFIAIVVALNLEPTLLSTITILTTMFTLQLIVLYEKELFGDKK